MLTSLVVELLLMAHAYGSSEPYVTHYKELNNFEVSLMPDGSYLLTNPKGIHHSPKNISSYSTLFLLNESRPRPILPPIVLQIWRPHRRLANYLPGRLNSYANVLHQFKPSRRHANSVSS